MSTAVGILALGTTDVAQTYNVTPETSTLRMANQYVTAFNALAAQLASEADEQ
ncbi:hypothetical protein [Streptomyces sp. NPDC050560]|uniref:hypothetical protein n=1 Tax=Streptomyces sp. NPDC050560 TaxID=3365630 RepID=UPI0037AF14DE